MTDFSDSCFGCGGHLRQNVYSGDLCPPCERRRDAGEMDALGRVKPVTVQPRLPDRRYVDLHRKCAAGTILPDESAELDMMCAEKERAYADEHGA